MQSEVNFVDLWSNCQNHKIKLFLVFSSNLLCLEIFFLKEFETGAVCLKSQGDTTFC